MPDYHRQGSYAAEASDTPSPSHRKMPSCAITRARPQPLVSATRASGYRSSSDLGIGRLSTRRCGRPSHTGRPGPPSPRDGACEGGCRGRWVGAPALALIAWPSAEGAPVLSDAESTRRPRRGRLPRHGMALAAGPIARPKTGEHEPPFRGHCPYETRALPQATEMAQPADED
jgi:hypothetical protein